MADKKEHTFCVTCHTELPPDTEIFYFSQEPLRPTKDDLSFGNEVITMLYSMKALFDTIGYGANEDEETDEALAKLGLEIADEAIRRANLMRDAQALLWKRWDNAKKHLSGQLEHPEGHG